MPFESITDTKINELLTIAKKVINPRSRSKEKDGHEQYNYKLHSETEDLEFELYTRQNLREGMEDDFSCGISWLAPNGESFTLKRYNGPSHKNKNQLEGTSLDYKPHIHLSTERYVRANRKAEGFAEETNRYNSLKGALHCLVTDCNISGINTEPDNASQIKLFE
jgi:hypothetical protein